MSDTNKEVEEEKEVVNDSEFCTHLLRRIESKSKSNFVRLDLEFMEDCHLDRLCDCVLLETLLYSFDLHLRGSAFVDYAKKFDFINEEDGSYSFLFSNSIVFQILQLRDLKSITQKKARDAVKTFQENRIVTVIEGTRGSYKQRAKFTNEFTRFLKGEIWEMAKLPDREKGNRLAKEGIEVVTSEEEIKECVAKTKNKAVKEELSRKKADYYVGLFHKRFIENFPEYKNHYTCIDSTARSFKSFYDKNNVTEDEINLYFDYIFDGASYHKKLPSDIGLHLFTGKFKHKTVIGALEWENAGRPAEKYKAFKKRTQDRTDEEVKNDKFVQKWSKK